MVLHWMAITLRSIATSELGVSETKMEKYQ